MVLTAVIIKVIECQQPLVKSQLKVVSGTVSKGYILNDIMVQCDCITYPIRNYILCKTMPRVITQISANGIKILDWPGNLPDLNAIEEVWNVIKTKCGRLEINKMELLEGVCRALYSLSRQRLMKLYD